MVVGRGSIRFGSLGAGALTVLLCALLSLFVFASSALAQDAVNGPPAKRNAGVGTLVAAAMETAGYVSQAQVLSDLATMLERLGALIYVCCIFAALLSVAISGRYDLGLWLLMGPPLFFFLIKPSVSSGGAEWQFGAFKDRGERQHILDGANVQLSGDAKVSFFFHGFNVLVSDTVQQLIKVITKDSVRQQMLFMARQQVMDDLFSTKVDKPDLEALVAATGSQCWRELNAARVLGVGRRDPRVRASPEYQRALQDYCELFIEGKNRVYLAPGPARDYVVDQLQMESRSGDPDFFFSNLRCTQLWDWVREGVEKRAALAKANALNERLDPQAPEEIYNRVQADIVNKLKSPDKPDQEAPQDVLECPSGASAGTAFTAPTDDGTKLQLMLSAWMLRKQFADDPRGGMISQFAEHSGIELQPLNYHNAHSQEAAYEIVRRFRLDRLAEVTRFEAFSLAMTLPYVQGIGLYLLGTLFPFFALFVLMPGQAGSFFMWCALWVWLKSWDVGWALVMVADELLWSVMPHSSFFRLGPNGGDPITIFEAAFDGDYGYNLATYYMLVAAMISAVPIISANAVLGSKKAIAGLFVDGLKSMGSQLSTHVGDMIGPEQLEYVDQRREYSPVQNAARKLVREQISMLYSHKMYDGAGGTNQAFLDSLSTVAGLDRVAQETAIGLRTTLAASFPQLQGKDFDLDGLKAQARQELEAIRDGHSTIVANNATMSEHTSHNKFLDLANSFVMDSNGKRRQLGFAGAMVEVARQSGMDLRELREMAKRQWGIEDGDYNALFGDGSKALKFAAGYEHLEDPRTRNYDPRGELPLEIALERRAAEHQESMADYYKGMSELMRGAGVAGSVLGAGTFPGLGKMAFTGGLGSAEAVYQMGLSYERTASSIRADYLQRVANEFYFQGGASQEWLFYEQIRAGISLREEWWNVPDAPADNRAGAEMRVKRLEGEAMNITGKGAGNIFRNFTDSF